MKKVIVAAVLLLFAACAHAQDIAGDWDATMHAGADFHLVLHIAKSDGGGLKATFDTVDQGGYGIPVTSISLKDSALSLGLDTLQAKYEGKVFERRQHDQRNLVTRPATAARLQTRGSTSKPGT